MSINLGLSRIVKLLNYLGNPHEKLRVLHVAGTNGKGSVCSYLTSLLQQDQYTISHIGKFTTPHLIHVTDSITINNKPIPWDAYTSIRETLDVLNSDHGLRCTEFELLTCTALKYFHDVNCDWCVIEVGLGGRLDATNIIPGSSKHGCGITKIGFDHEAFLGNTLGKIAKEKAGIVTKGVDFAVLDGSNEQSIIDAVREQCKAVGCELKITDPNPTDTVIITDSWGRIAPKKLPLNGAYQIFNLRVALSILDHLQKNKEIHLTNDKIGEGLKNVKWPGRLQELDYCYDSAKKSTIPMLLDGAHNGSAAIELAKFLRTKYGDGPLTFVIAVTNGKNLDPLLGPLLRPQDRVIVTEFGLVDDMPWIHAMDSEELSEYINLRYTKNVENQPLLRNIIPSLASEKSESPNPIVVCGSLYLCGQLLRIHDKHLRI